MSKAFDRVEQQSFEILMQKMNFPRHFISLIMNYITTVFYSVLLNGIPTLAFIPSWDIRQGDPLSPYLFILCSEGLSDLLRCAEETGALRGFDFGRGATILHLLFAVDSLLFALANISQAAKLKEIFSIYEDCSRQTINYDKSSLFFSKAYPVVLQQAICTLLRISERRRNNKYLGLPFMTGRSKKYIFSYLHDWVWKKLNSWKEKTLPQTVKEVLIKLVV